MDFLSFFLALVLNVTALNIGYDASFQKDERLVKTCKHLRHFLVENPDTLTLNSKKIRDLLHKEGVYSYQILPFISQKKGRELEEDFRIFLSLNKKNYSHIGYILEKDYSIALLVNANVDLSVLPIKRYYKQYDRVTLAAKHIQKEIKTLYLYVSSPSKKIKKILIPVIQGQFSFQFKLKERGRYVFEVLLDNAEDPKILSKLSLNVGKHAFEEDCKGIDSKADLLHEINRVRITNGRHKLKEFLPLSEISYQHSKDMAKNQFFSHRSNNGETPYQRIKKLNIPFGKLLENISQAPKLCLAHTEILESPGHLNNLLSEGVNRIGIGIYKQNDLFYLTENFIQLNQQKSIEAYEGSLKKQFSKLDMQAVSFLNGIAKRKNYNEYYKMHHIPKKLPIYVREFKEVKSYFFILNHLDDEFLSTIKDMHQYGYYGYSMKKFQLGDKSYLFLTLILANL